VALDADTSDTRRSTGEHVGDAVTDLERSLSRAAEIRQRLLEEEGARLEVAEPTAGFTTQDVGNKPFGLVGLQGLPRRLGCVVGDHGNRNAPRLESP
jgi:hypothetical protein